MWNMFKVNNKEVLFCVARSLICNCLLLKDTSFNTFQKFEIVLVLLGESQNFQKCTQAIYPKPPSQACDYWYKLKQLKQLFQQIIRAVRPLKIVATK